jgi:acyl-CoA synthetase (AMP-forming)/AMP-acid ligase II
MSSALPPTIGALVRSAADEHAGLEAVVDGGQRLSFADLGSAVTRAARATIASGVQPGDRVAIWAPNRLEWVVGALGALTAGAALVPMNTRYKAEEAGYLLNRSRARLLLVSPPFLGNDYEAMLRAAFGERGLRHLETVVTLGGPAWESWLSTGDRVDAAAVDERVAATGPEATSDIIFTSGTTGRPKGVVTTHFQSLRVFDTWAEIVGLRNCDRYLIVNPFFHTFGYKAGILACLLRGATILPQSSFDPVAVMEAIARERVTVLPGPPTLYQTLLDHPDRERHDLSSLRLAVTGAAVVPVALVRRMQAELGLETVLTAYGLTEATGTVTMCRRDDDPETIAGTSGRPIPDTEVRVVDTGGTPLGAGEPGEVQVRGYHVMQGYFEDAEATAEAIVDGGWLRTGDIGVLDERGNLKITDRLKDMFVVGGFNAYPAEIEQVIAGHPAVSEAAVVGVPDGRLGEVGRAYLVLRPGVVLDPDELIAWCRERMANFKVPRAVEVVDTLPRNASGKVLKFALRQGSARY